MSALVVLGLGALAVGALGLWFWDLERRGRSVVVLAFIVGFLVVEGSMYPGFDAPAGLLHPTFGSVSFRPHEVLIVVALVARLVARGAPTRIGTPMIWWVAFLAWMGLAAFVGVYVGHSGLLVAFEAKAVIYLGAIALGAGVPSHDLVGGPTIRRLIVFSAVVSTFMIVLDSAGVRITGRFLGLPLEDSGRMGADAASIFLALGLLSLGLAVSRRQGRLPLLLAACPLCLSTFVPSQRAVLVTFAVLLTLVPLAFLSSAARARVHASPVEVVSAGLLLLTLVTVPWVLSGMRGESTPSYPLAPNVTAALTDRSKHLSAEDRVNQYRKAWPLMTEKPFLGWGLGKTYAHFHPGPDEFEENNLTHNIAGDLVLRTGLAGFALFALALSASLRDGWRAWRDRVDDAVACVALACVVVLAGLVAKGMVESLFEKFRLAVLIGVFLGILRSVVTSARVAPAQGAAAGEIGAPAPARGEARVRA